MNPVERVKDVLAGIPTSIYGGSAEGRLYQDYPWPPFDTIPAAFHSTARKLGIIEGALGDVKGKCILDMGCANGAVSIGLALKGARVLGVDAEPLQLDVAEIVAGALGVEVSFVGMLIAPPGVHFDAALFLSVWKWIVRNEGREQADETLRNIARIAKVLLFDAGVSDGAGTDLGVGLKVGEVPEMVRTVTSYTTVELAGAFEDEHGIKRTIWRCER